MFANMKFTFFTILSLSSIYLVFTQMIRKIKINQERFPPTTVPSHRTMRSFKINPSVFERKTTPKIPHIVDKTCLLLPDPGPCRAKISMWYFDPETKNCSAFYWGGCQGNGNRFDKLGQCLSTCLSSPDWKEGRPRYCSLTFDYGWCFGAEDRYYYDRYWGVCKKTIYSGCGGNKNNFYSKEKCDDVCRLGTWNLGPKTTREDKPKKILIINPNLEKNHGLSTSNDTKTTTTPSGWHK